MTAYEVSCEECGTYFNLDTDFPELGEIEGTCPYCGVTSDFPMTFIEH